MRIISRKYKNRKLRTLSENIVRPTSASVRKSIFQILEPFDSKVVLDLFAGIGSLGIESLSRGALEATFVEKNKKVINVLSDNLKNLCDEHSYSLMNMPVENYLNPLTGKQFIKRIISEDGELILSENNSYDLDHPTNQNKIFVVFLTIVLLLYSIYSYRDLNRN